MDILESKIEKIQDRELKEVLMIIQEKLRRMENVPTAIASPQQLAIIVNKMTGKT